MKVLESMAMIAARKDSNHDLDEVSNFAYGFEAGFRAAREMAKNKSREYSHTNLCTTKSDLFHCDAACELVGEISKLGEGEVCAEDGCKEPIFIRSRCKKHYEEGA